MIIDYSTSRPAISTLKAEHVTAVGRYIGWDSVPGYSSIGKNIHKAEAQALLAAGIDIFLFFEYAADAALKGLSQGRLDGELATNQLHDLGAPADMAVFFALDFDLKDYAPALPDTPAYAREKLGPVADYFHGIASTSPEYIVGVYGGLYAVRRVLNAGLAHMAVQTIAWSGGQWDNRAVLRQLARQVFGSADVDLLRPGATDFGQWPRPHRDGPYRHVASGNESLDDIAHQRGTTGAHLLDVSLRAYTASDTANLLGQKLPQGTPYYTSNP